MKFGGECTTCTLAPGLCDACNADIAEMRQPCVKSEFNTVILLNILFVQSCSCVNEEEAVACVAGNIVINLLIFIQ